MTAIRIRLGLATSAAALVLAVSTTIAGQASAPPTVAPPTSAKATGETSDRSDIYRDVYQGWKWWHVYCYRCHGVDALGTTVAPNLTDPNEKLSRAAFLKIVRDGVPDQGMQAWNKLLDNKQIGQIHVYVRARADKVLPPGRPDEVGPNGGPWVPPAGWVPR